MGPHADGMSEGKPADVADGEGVAGDFLDGLVAGLCDGESAGGGLGAGVDCGSGGFIGGLGCGLGGVNTAAALGFTG